MTGFPRIEGPQVREWSDWITPILIKELRQSTRETSFVVVFLLLQFSMAFLALANLAGERVAQQDRILFDYCLFGVFLGVLPLWSSFSLSTEVRQNTLETMMLTRMSAWWIVLGKWIARAFQSFLIASTVLPYFILQYLNGSEDLVSDLEFLALLFLGNLVLIAAGLGLSVISNTFIKTVSLIALLIFTLVVINAYAINLQLGYSTTRLSDVFEFIIALSIIYISIDLTASELNSETSNNPFYRRLYCLLLICSYYAVTFLFDSNRSHYLTHASAADSDSYVQVLLLFLLTIFGFIEGSRVPLISKRLIRSYKKWGRMGRWAYYLFMPGWPSALLFGLPSLLIVFLCSFLRAPSLPFIDILAFLGSLFIPLILNTIGLSRFAIPGFVVLGFNFVSVILVAGLARPFHNSPYKSEIILPIAPCFATLSSMTPSDSLVASISCGVMTCILLLLAIPWFKRMNRAWLEVSAEK